MSNKHINKDDGKQVKFNVSTSHERKGQKFNTNDAFNAVINPSHDDTIDYLATIEICKDTITSEKYSRYGCTSQCISMCHNTGNLFLKL